MKGILIYLMGFQLRKAVRVVEKYKMSGDKILAKAHRAQVLAYADAIMFLRAEKDK